jgi:spore coat protein CotH
MEVSRKLKLILSFLFICSVNIQSKAVNGDKIFLKDTIHEIRLTFKQPKFWEILTSNYETAHDINLHENERVDTSVIMAKAVIDGIKVDSIGVKLKSNSSYSILTDKKPLKLYFNAYKKGKRFDGLLKLNLSNEFPDPSMLRNTVAYKILRDAGVMAPRTSFAKVYLNNKYYGLYAVIEQVDKAFIEQNFKSSGGELIKGIAGYLYWFEGDTLSFKDNYDFKSNESKAAWTRLIAFAKKINTTSGYDFNDSLKNIFDIDSYIKVMAADIVFNNWDSYFYGQNYYLYRDTTENKYYYLPWDYNMSLNNYDVSGSDYSILPDETNNDLFQLPLPNRIVSNDFLKQRYLTEVNRINTLMSAESLEKFIIEKHNQIVPAMKADTLKGMMMEDFNNSLLHRVDISDDVEFEGLLSFIRYRHQQVTKMLDKAGWKENMEFQKN